MSSSTNTVTSNAAHLAQLKRQFDVMKSLSDINSCFELEQRMEIAYERKPLLDQIEKYELLVENDRVTDAIQKFEELHPRRGIGSVVIKLVIVFIRRISLTSSMPLMI